MQKIVINSCFGGFMLSYEAVMMYAKKKGITLYSYVRRDCINMDDRYDPCTGGNPYEIYYATKPATADGILPSGYWFDVRDIRRDDPALVEVVEELGDRANSGYSKLQVVEIPDGVEWEIEEYDGYEQISERHRIWG